MWLVAGGRQIETIVDIIKDYNEKDIRGEKYLEDILNKQDEYKDIRNILVLDTGLKTLQDWSIVRRVRESFKETKIILYTRYPEMTPNKDILGKEIEVFTNKEKIPLSDIAKNLRNYE